MGTRGYIVVKYNKKYYTRYNGMDSYPEGLGKKIVDHLEYLKCNHPYIDTEQYKEYILSVAKDNCTEISEKEPETTHMIQWIYIIDVDEMTFSIKGGYYEPSYKIKDILPRDDDSESSDSSDSSNDEARDDDSESSDSSASSNDEAEIEKYIPWWLNDFQKNNEKLAEEKNKESQL